MERIIRTILRQLMNRGMRAGINRMANRGRDPKDMTPEERARARSTRETAKRARQAMRIGRRGGRF